MPEQPNHCTTCGKLIPDTVAYYCSPECAAKYDDCEFAELIREVEAEVLVAQQEVRQAMGATRAAAICLSIAGNRVVREAHAHNPLALAVAIKRLEAVLKQNPV